MEDLKKKFQDEIAVLENELRVVLPREILKARAHGDLSENAEYHAAKERQGMVNARHRAAPEALARALDDRHVTRFPQDRVGLGSTVMVLDTNKNEEVNTSWSPAKMPTSPKA